jgi:HsdM N-terminal domain
MAKPQTKKARKLKARQPASNGANLGFEQKLWAAADKLRGHMDAAEYKHVVLGQIFADPEDGDEYTAENVFWVQKHARWPHIQDKAKQTTIGQVIDDAMVAMEKNIFDWRAERLSDDKHWQHGAPPASNAIFARVQHIVDCGARGSTSAARTSHWPGAI